MGLFTDLEKAEKRARTGRRLMVAAHVRRINEAEREIPDFVKVLKGMKGTEIDGRVVDAIMLSEKSGLLSYFIAKFPDQLEILNSLADDERSLDREIGRLELLTEFYVEGKKPRFRVRLPSS